MKKLLVCMLTCFMAVSLLAGCGKKEEAKTVELDKDNPTVISVWHYYNGAQQEAFESLVSQFNNSDGKDEGIYVETYAQGNVYDLEKTVLNSANKKAGASEMPNIFAAYADTAYQVNKLGLVADLNEYLTKDEIGEYVDNYIEEGELSRAGELKIFPVAKATEVLAVNQTDWEKFSKATGAKTSDLSTIEGLVKTAEKYYKWTDKATKTPNDGKAFYGRDAMANYFFVGAKQQGVDLLKIEKGKCKINFDKKVVRKLWDNYYTPYIKGYFTASGRYRSDDMKMGSLIAFTGSSSGAAYYLKAVTVNDKKSYPIKVRSYEVPKFADEEDYSVQQGAGMVVTKSSDKEIYASVQFLKWFTEAKRNFEFAATSSYLPVKKEANTEKAVEKAMKDEKNEDIKDTVMTAVKTVNNNKMYTPKAAKNGSQIRNILETCLSDKADQDRKAVEKAIKGGMSYEAAVKKYNTDQNFEQWYEKTLKELKTLEG